MHRAHESIEATRTHLAHIDPARTFPLVVVLRLFGTIDMLAWIAVFMPVTWIEFCHAWAGLGPFPSDPVTHYLARSASTLYALYGVLLIYMSCDVVRYWLLIRLLARIVILYGCVVLAIDWVVGMPVWWIVLEGPAFATTGITMLILQRIAATSDNLPRFCESRRLD